MLAVTPRPTVFALETATSTLSLELERPPTLSALIVVLAQNLASLSVEEMQPGAGRAGFSLVLVVGNIWVVIQLVLDVETGRRAPEDGIGHHENMTNL